jgi:regulator of sigma D
MTVKQLRNILEQYKGKKQQIERDLEQVQQTITSYNSEFIWFV